MPVDFILLALTLVCVALFHHHTLKVALIGLAVITLFKLVASPFAEGSGVEGLFAHLEHEWVLLTNLLGLLLGFALLSKHFEASNVPAWLRGGWHVVLAYVIGFALLLTVHGWTPDPPHRVDSAQRGAAVATQGHRS